MVSLAGLGGAASVAVVIKGVDEFSKVFSNAESKITKMGSGLKSLGTAMTGLGAGAAVGIGSLVKSFSDVETGFAKVNTLLGEGQDAEEVFGEKVKELNVLMGDQGDQLSALEGLYQTMSAGITDADDAQTFLTNATKASVGGFAELGTVIEAGTKTMASFGISAEDSARVFDVFAATVQAGQTDMTQLANAFPRVASLASEMGVSLEETAGTFAGLTKVMASPEQASTGLAAALMNLLKPSKEMEAAFKTLGVESGKALVEQEGLMGALQALKGIADGAKANVAGLSKGFAPYVQKVNDLEAALTSYKTIEATSTSQMEGKKEMIKGVKEELSLAKAELEAYGASVGMSSADIEKMNEKSQDSVSVLGRIFQNAESLRAVFPALGSASDDIAASIEQVGNSVGTVNKQFGDVAETTKYQFGAALSELKNILIEVGGEFAKILVPVLQKDVLPAIQKLVTWWENLAEDKKGLIMKIGLLTTAFLLVLGPLALIVGWFTTLLPLLGFIGTAVGVLGGILTGPILIAIGAVIAAIAAVIAIIIYWDEILTFISKAWELFMNVLNVVWEWIKTAIVTLWEKIKDVMSQLWEFLRVILTNIITKWDEFKMSIFKIWDKIKDGISKFLNFIKKTGTQILNFFKDFGTEVSNIWDKAKNSIASAVSKIISKMREMYDNIVNIFKDLATKAYNWGKDLLNNFIRGIKSLIGKVKDVAKKVLSYFKFDIISNDKMAQKWGSDFITHFSKGIKNNSDLILDVNNVLGNITTPIVSNGGTGETISNNNITVSVNANVNNNTDIDVLAREIGNQVYEQLTRR